jgi:hypothetical protein
VALTNLGFTYAKSGDSLHLSKHSRRRLDSRIEFSHCPVKNSLRPHRLSSGLSQRFLLQSIRKDKLKAFKHEKDWRIKRADLDSFVREL